MIRFMVRLCVFLLAAGLIGGCRENRIGPGDTSPVAGDKLFIPDGYQSQLSRMKLTEVKALPYFSKPFVTVAKDASGRQWAVVFQSAGEARKVKLPRTYEEMAAQVKSGPVNATDAEMPNLILFEHDGQLYWVFTNGSGTRYWDLNGRTVNPFGVPDFHQLFVTAAELRIQYGDGNELTVKETGEIGNLTAAMQGMTTVVPASAPDAVGFSFILEIDHNGETVHYSSVGDFVYRGEYYHCENVDAIKQLSSRIVGYGQQRFPGLLGLPPLTGN